MTTKKDLPYNYALFAAVLKEGKENSLTISEIIQRLGWKENDRRNIYHIVNRLIVEYGYLIGSSRNGVNRGYYLISNHDEYKETIRVAEKQAQSELNKIKKLQENYMQQIQ